MSTPDPSLYRPCVGTMMVNEAGHAFVGKRIDNKEGDWWQMPQGGVDPGEEMGQAMLRELDEETGVKAVHLKILGTLGRELFYDLPPELQGKLWAGQFIGQRQTWYLTRFTGEDRHIDLNAHKHPEFCEWKWVEPNLLPELIVPFKKAIYQTIVDEFAELI